MDSFASGAFRIVLRAACALLAPALLASCSGAVSGPPASSGPLSISPATATLYSDLPTTFVVAGGNGSYLITSSDQNVLPVAGSFQGTAFTVVPGPVAADTPVTLTVRDTGSATPVTATLTVKPRTVSNVVTVTPSASQSAACGASICAGGDAEVKVQLAQAGIPLVNREVRFDVVSGDVRIITSPPGVPEALSLSGTTLTDSSGTARVRVRVLTDATSQTALLQITDVSSGAFTRTGVAIAPSSNAPLSAQPDTITFVGIDATTCASGIAADVIVFGGRPPYAISQPGTFSVTPQIVTSSGGRFTVRSTGQCSDGSPIAVVDNNGAAVTVTASNRLGDPITNAPALVVAPTAVTIESCNQTASVVVSGGSGDYLVASGHSGITAFPSQVRAAGTTVLIQRVRGGASSAMSSAIPPPAEITVPIGISDGREAIEVSVTVTGSAVPRCS